jgi:hypothetical protein
MISLHHIEAVSFCTHFLAFCKQSVKGSIMAIFKVYSEDGKFGNYTIEKVAELLNNGHFVFQNNIQYLNYSWESYHCESDEYVVGKINLMMKFGKYLHSSCIFNEIWNFSQTLLYYVLARIDLNNLKDGVFLSESIEIIMDAVLSFHVDEIILRNNFCNEDCDHFQYKKGEEFIKIKKLKN